MPRIALGLSFLLAAPSSFATEIFLEAQWPQAVPIVAPRFKAADPTELPDAGQGLPCVEFGRHTEKAPWYDPFYHGCTSDPLSDPAAMKASFAALVDKVAANGNVLWNSAGEMQKALGKGNRQPDALSETDHWSDIAYLLYKKDGANWVPASVVLATYRAYDSRAGNNIYLEARWMTFAADLEGRLLSVEANSGERSPATGKIMWVQNGKRMLGDPNNMPEIYQRYYHQLLSAWATR